MNFFPTRWIPWFITTSSRTYLEVLEQALASPASRIVVEKPTLTLPQIEKLKAPLAQPGASTACAGARSLDGASR